MARDFEGVKTAEVNGISLAYRDQGEGEAVVFVHGSFSDLRSWDPQVEALGRNHRAIAYSRRYSPPNDPIPTGVDDQMDPHVDDLIGFLTATGAVPAHLVGNSLGAFIALLLAIRRPDLVKSLVLGEPPAVTLFTSMPPKPSEMLRLLLRRPRTAFAIGAFGARAIAPAEKEFRRNEDRAGMLAFVHGALGKDAYEAMSEDRQTEAEQNLAPFKASILGAGYPPLSESQLRSLALPTLLLEGGNTRAFFRRILDRLEQLIPDTGRKVLPGATHTQEENPVAMSRILLDWMSRG
jgi:pimeloyl-ACP methyl ester carboxylesterase